MGRSTRRSAAHEASFGLDDDELVLLPLQTVAGGEPRTGQLTGTKALMLAVLEDGIRSYLGGSHAVAADAELWIYTPGRQYPFSFAVVCEILGLDPEAARKTLRRMKNDQVSGRKLFPRTRQNVRIPGRVHIRKAH